MNNLHPTIAASLANWMPKPAPARVECAQAAIENVVKMTNELCGIKQAFVLPSRNSTITEIRMKMMAAIPLQRALVQSMAEQLREEYASGLDAPDNREVEQ